MNRRKLSHAVSTVAINVAFLGAMNLALSGLGCGVAASDAANEQHAAQATAAENLAAAPVSAADARVAHIQSQLSRSTWQLQDAVDEGDAYVFGADAQLGNKMYRYIVHVSKTRFDAGTDLTTRMLETYRATLIGPDGKKIEDSSLIVHAAIQAMTNVKESDFKSWADRPANAAALHMMSAQLGDANMGPQTTEATYGGTDCTTRIIWISAQWALFAAGLTAAIAAIVAFWPQITAVAAGLLPFLQGMVAGAWAWFAAVMGGGGGAATTLFTSQIAAAEGAIIVNLAGPALASLAALVAGAIAAVSTLVVSVYTLVQSTYQWFVDCQSDPTIGNGRDGYTSVSCTQSSPNGQFDPNAAQGLCRGVVSNWVTGYRAWYSYNYWTCGDCWASPGWCGADTLASCTTSINACVALTTRTCLAQPGAGGGAGGGGGVPGPIPVANAVVVN